MKIKSVSWIIVVAIITGFLFKQCNRPDAGNKQKVITGAERTELYLPILKSKNVAVVSNQSSRINNTHLVDSLISLKINVVTIFTPEHGLRGINDAEEITGNYIDKKTGVEVISLYGEKLKPDIKDLIAIDIVVFDLQDVGTRFYTYISTMHYVMEACAENNIDLMVFDRPNPNGYFVDGPVREAGFKSFVGMHPVPVVHGMTIGEYALLVNGESWLTDGIKCSLKVISCENYDHNTYYELPVKPSPNLPNMTSIYLYPGLCFFEGTQISIGRGTDFPFQVIGHPDLPESVFTFRPRSIPGASKHPKLEGELCYAYDLREYTYKHFKKERQIQISWLLKTYNILNNGQDFFNGYFDTLAGTDKLRNQILSGKTESEIRTSWENDLVVYKKMRKPYLLYKDFE